MRKYIQRETLIVDKESGVVEEVVTEGAIDILTKEETEKRVRMEFVKTRDIGKEYNKLMKDITWLNKIQQNPKLIYIAFILSTFIERETNYLIYKKQYITRKFVVKLFGISNSLASRYMKILSDANIIKKTDTKDGKKCYAFNPFYIHNGAEILLATINEFKDGERQ